MVIALDTLRRAGFLDSVPFDLSARSAELGVDAKSAARLVTLLAHADVVVVDGAIVSRGNQFPSEPDLRQCGQHANAIRQWSGQLDDRLRGTAPSDDTVRFDREAWLKSMAAGAIRDSWSIADRVLGVVPDARTVLDLGGGHGEYGRAFAKRGLQVTMLDRPDIIEFVRSRGWLADDGIALIPGDFHVEIPGGPYDVVLCFGITHTFGPEANASFFRRVAQVVSPRGVVVVSTFFGGTGQRADLFAVHMLANRSGGDAHPERSYRAWLEDAGFVYDGTLADRGEGRALVVAHRRTGAGATNVSVRSDGS